MENNRSNFDTMKRNKTVRIVLISLLALLTIAVIIMSVFLGLGYSDRKDLRNNMDNIYQASYYELLTNILDIENDLCKIKAMRSPGLLSNTLDKVVINCQRASLCISTMSTETSNMATMLKFVNQVGDYSSHLVRQLEENQKLEKSEYEHLANMWQIANKFGRTLSALQDRFAEGYSFIAELGAQDDIFANMLQELENGSIEYPSLIYDGPFSDGVKDRPALGVKGDELTGEQGIEKIKEYLVGYEIVNINFSGENLYRIPSYLYEVTLKGDRMASVQITKQGGMLLMMDIYHNVSEPTLSVEECVKLAEQYCSNIGMKSMKAVWQSNNNSVVYINLCYEQDGVIIYPDMVKIKVSLDTGEIIGYEGLNYAFNHTDRTFEEPKVSEEEVLLNVAEELKEVEARLVVIPYTVMTERYCYEISGKIGDELYMIYVDVYTGNEIKVLRVIDSNQGEMLM